MARFRLDRRTFLRGAAGGVSASLALPVLEAMLDGNGAALASGAPLPRRLGVFFWGNGVRPRQWLPAGTGADWTPSEELAPLAPLKPWLSVVSGLEVKHRGAGHHVGRAAMLTGAYEPNRGTYGSVDGPSIDQVAARAWQGSTPFASIEIGISTTSKGGGRAGGSTAWAGPSRSLPCEFSPRNLFNRLFALRSPTDGARELALRRGILDLVAKDASALRARLGASDRARLEAHLEGIRALERTLEPKGAECPAPSAPEPLPDMPGREPLAERNKQMADILAVALACDLTRAFTYQYTTMQADTIFWQIGATEGSHVMTHDDRGLPTRLEPQYEKVHKVVVLVMSHFAYLLERLRSIPEGAGTLLDRCCIYATSEVNDGTSHSITDMPVLIAGRAGGALRSGLHYRSTTKECATKALLTCLRAVGVPAESFGSGPGRVTEGLSALLA